MGAGQRVGGHEGGAAPAKRLRPGRRVDARLLVGILMVLASMVAGSRLLADPDDTIGVWVARVPLAAGTEVRADDLRVARVVLAGSTDAYVAASEPIVGTALSRDVAAGELVPVEALGHGADARLVSIPVEGGHVPAGLVRGQRVDVFATYDAQGPAPRTERLLAGATVQDVAALDSALVGGGSASLVVVVPPDRAAAVVAAVRSASLDVTRVGTTG